MAIMSGLVLYILPGMLGRLYDMRNGSIGPDIFDHKDLKQAYKIENYKVSSEYKIVSELTEAKDFLDVKGKLSLDIKSGRVKVDGTGDYLKEATSYHNKVDLLVRVHYETVTYTLPSALKPITHWQDVADRFRATHYIRSIKYGGDLIATVRFTTDNENDKQVIKGEIEGALNSKSGSFGLGLKGGLDKIKEKIRDSAQMEINYYATVPVENIPRTIEAMTELITKFPEQTKEINNGFGVPLEMEVFSLVGLGKDMEAYFQTLAFQDQLLIMDEQFSDILNTKKQLADWLKTVPPVLESSEIKKISDFQTQLESMSMVFSDVINKMDLSREGKADQFMPAFNAYQGDKGFILPDMLLKQLSVLKKEVLENTQAIEVDFGGPIYNYWGSVDCPQKSTKVFSGTMSTSAANSVGPIELICLPDEAQRFPHTEEDGRESPDESGEDDDEEEKVPYMLPVVFESRKSFFSDFMTIKCASCRIPGKTTVTMLPATTTCPPEWTEQYKGVLVTTNHHSVRGELVCLDRSKSNKRSDVSKNTVITEVSPRCGNFPCSSQLSVKTSIPCIVCSITRSKKSIAEVLF